MLSAEPAQVLCVQGRREQYMMVLHFKLNCTPAATLRLRWKQAGPTKDTCTLHCI